MSTDVGMFVIFADLAIFVGVAFVMIRGDSPRQALLNGAAATLGAIVLVGVTADLTKTSSLPFEAVEVTGDIAPSAAALFAIAVILIAIAGGVLSAFVQAENRRLAKFAENALISAEAGRAAIEILSSDEYDSASRPSLGNLFMEMARPGISKELLRSKEFPLSDVAMLGAWCYSRAAVVGMVASSSEDPMPILVSVWKPESIDTYWRLVQEEIERLGVLSSGGIPGLAGLRGQTGYPELFGEEAISLALADPDSAIRLAQSRVSATDAHTRWSSDSAIGLGVGLRMPDFIDQCLEADANPDPQRWTEWRQAGLDIPSQPDAIPASEQIEEVIDSCRSFFKQHYPDASGLLEQGIAARRARDG